MTDELKVGRLARDLHGAEIVIKREANKPTTLTFPVSSETPVERWFGTEILRHDDKSIRMDRVRAGAIPLLFNHNWSDPIGMVDGARVEDGRLYVDAHFFDTERAREVATMVDGGMRNVSLGYELYTVEEDTKRNTYTATDWGPLEASFAPVPADIKVGVGRAADEEAKVVRVRQAEEPAGAPAAPVQVVNVVGDLPAPKGAKLAAVTAAVRSLPSSPPAAPAASERKTMTVETEAAAGAVAETKTETRAAQPRQGPSALELEKARTRGIENLCKASAIDDNIRDHWVGQGLSLDEVSDEILAIVQERGKRNEGKTAAALGLSDKETQRFSLFNAIRAVADKNWTHAGFELECSREIAKRLNKITDPNKFYVPVEVQQRSLPGKGRRDLSVGTSSAGGYLVETANQSFIELMRNRSVVYSMGARRLAGLVGSVTVPKQTGAATAVWLSSETATATESAQTFGQMALTPKSVGAYTEISRQLMLQSSPDAEGIVTSDLAAVCALAIDVGALRGSGASGEPQGIVGTSGVGSVTGTSLAAAGILEFQSDVAAGNLLSGNFGYVTTPAVAALLMARPELPSTGTTRLWTGSMLEGQLFGMRAMSSAQMSSATMLGGDFSQVVIAEWGVLEVEVNPYANFQAGIIGVRAMVSIDVGVRYGGAFSYASSIT